MPHGPLHLACLLQTIVSKRVEVYVFVHKLDPLCLLLVGIKTDILTLHTSHNVLKLVLGDICCDHFTLNILDFGFQIFVSVECFVLFEVSNVTNEFRFPAVTFLALPGDSRAV